jgi:Tfp pilus assembly protein PilN
MLTNLLPPQNKIELFEEKIKNLIIILGILILVSLFSFSLILFGIEKYVSSQVDLEKMKLDLEKKEIETSEIQDLRKKTTSLNQILSQLDSFYQNQNKLSLVFNKISEILPPQMYLTNFSYQEELNQVSLSGFSSTKEILYEFSKNLEKEFPEVYFPLQNWVKSTDIDFQCSFKIKK